MTLGEMFLGVCILLTGWFWAVLLARLNRIEDRLAYLSDRMATRDEVAAIRFDLSQLALVVTGRVS